MKELSVVNIGEFAGDSFNENSETSILNDFKYYPCGAITVEEASVEIEDDYNCHVEVTMSTGDELEFIMEEKRRGEGAGPWYDMYVK
jgi:hypothetical protein